MTITRFAAYLALPLLALLQGGCASNPATGGTNVVLMSESQEIKIGREAHEKMMEEGAAYPDQALQDYVNRVGQKLAATSDRPDIEYYFTVINSEQINAFALPGGYIYINRGLMVYLDNEEELAAVLAHEIGHVTARHAVRQKTATTTNSILAQLAYVTTGSADLAQASNMYGTSLVRGYGREMELEADGEGAEYLHNAGYDPNALLDVIGVLKDQETYQRARAKAAGRQPQSYHGLYATHPRNDKRLQQVIRTAADLEPRYDLVPPDAEEWRKYTEGLAYGQSSAAAEREEDRYYHNKLGFTFKVPEGWSVQRGSRAITISADDGSGRLTLTLQRYNKGTSPSIFLSEQVKAPDLMQSEPLVLEGLTGHTGVAPDNSGNRRVAMAYRGSLAYLFQGESTGGDFTALDQDFLTVIQSFRPIKPTEREPENRQTMVWVQAEPGDTMASIARGVRVSDAENKLRLMNGYYPKGEPRAGDWIKTVKTER
ncbi:MAG: M48 family metalloprotease [Halieaceae bacterium]|nr:M48 family metalloprotease [Halieaceae bacterium]